MVFTLKLRSWMIRKTSSWGIVAVAKWTSDSDTCQGRAGEPSSTPKVLVASIVLAICNAYHAPNFSILTDHCQRSYAYHFEKNASTQPKRDVRRRTSRVQATYVACGVKAMATAFRQYGHLEADLDPLKLMAKHKPAALDAAQFQPLFDKTLSVGAGDGGVAVPGLAHANGKQIFDHLRATYCGKMGFEFEHVSSEEEKQWLAQAIEDRDARFPVLPSDLRNAYTSMLMADVFETFMAKKFSSFKRYSGEGAEAMLPAINTVLHTAAASGNVWLIEPTPCPALCAKSVFCFRGSHELLSRISARGRDERTVLVPVELTECRFCGTRTKSLLAPYGI